MYTANAGLGVAGVIPYSTSGGETLRRAAVKTLVLTSVLTSLALRLPNDHLALQPYPGTGMFLMLSDIHFDPYADPAIVRELGAIPKDGCATPASSTYSKFGSDTNYPLLKSALDGVAATAAENRIHYDYAIVTGDFLAHGFDGRYRQCVGGGDEAYRKFARDTVSFVDRMIAKALPGVPVFAALGNNDSDRGDYERPTSFFLQSVGRDWSTEWGSVSASTREMALASFERAGNYAVPDPGAPKHEFVILNSNLWAARNAQACSESDPDPGGQFRWLQDALGRIKHAGGTATLIMHILPGIDALRSSMGQPQSLWTDRCTEKFIAELTEFGGVVEQVYAGHIHRDDFRLLPDREGRPLLPIHVVPSVSPVYFNNPAVEIGWYDKGDGDLRDYAPLYLDLADANPTWTTEYIFSRAYARPRPNIDALKQLTLAIHQGSPGAGVGEQYANHYGAGVRIFLTPDTWSNYSCAQTEIAPTRFAQCKRAAANPKP
ncbi:MAG: metallophosphoesterase [Terriglobia bacterium]